MKKIFATIFLLTIFSPLFAFTQNIGSSQPQDFTAPVNGQAAPTSFQIVPCNGVQTGADPLGSGAQVTGCDFNSLLTLVQRVINILLYVSIFIAIIMILYSGFLYLTAGGNASKTTQARKVIMATFIGMLIAFSSWVVVYTIVVTLKPNGTDTIINPSFNNSILLQKQ